MAAELKVFENENCTTETLIRYENTTGGPIAGVSVIDCPSQGAGNAPPDELTLDFGYNSGTAQWGCGVTRIDGSSYHVDDVVADGDNVNNIVPGVVVTLNALNILQTYQAKIYIGWNPGIIVAGNSSYDKKLWVKNVGDADGSDARIRILPDGDFENTVNTPIRAINENNYLQATPIGTFNIKVKADTSKIDVSYEGNNPVEKSIVADGATENEIATGIRAVFNSGLSMNDEANICISDGKSRVQIASDNNGTPGTFGTSDVVFGNMSIDDVECFWVRIVTQSGDSPSGNPRHANVQARITTI